MPPETPSIESPLERKERVYEKIAELYKYVMTSEEGAATVRWTGYGATVGFAVEGIGYHEPPLQRLLSLLHLRRDEPDFLEMVEKSAQAIKNFDYRKEVLPDFQQDFLTCGALEVIQKVGGELETVMQDS